ncbi:unnamed protein product [Durusdinium trenchii]|uniref:RAP domain-containing protein n=1 Tax=Durusdinium trenchii TaxID=1381693 RepID=A0ABP0PMX6_9DINO
MALSPLICRRGRLTFLRSAAWPRRWVRTQLVGQPTLAELLQTAERSSSWTATKCLAVLGEVTSRAIQENQVADLLQSPIFSSLLDRVQHRLYGFSASEAYLLLLCISRVKSALNASSVQALEPLQKRALEQLAEDLEELSSERLVEVLHLGSRGLGQALPEFWRELSELLSQRLDTGSLSPRALLLAADALASSAEEGIARSRLVPQVVRQSRECLEHFSLKQLARLAGDLHQLDVSQEILDELVQRLCGAAEALPPPALATAMTVAVRKEELELLQLRCLEIAHTCHASDAILTLRALVCQSSFPVELMILLLMQVVKQPRSVWSDVEERALHQVTLSILHDPNAEDVRRALEDAEELWDACYRPEEVVLEAPDEEALKAVGHVPEALQAAGIEVARVAEGQIIRDFYWLPMMIQLKDGQWLGIDADGRREDGHRDPFRRLKQRHLHLWDIPLLWHRREAGSFRGLVEEILPLTRT